MNVSIHILLKFATSKTGRNVIGGILLFIVTVLALLATLMACMASFVVAQFSDQFHPPMPHNTVISSSFTIGRKNPVTGEVENHYGTDFPAPEGTVIVASSAGTVQSKWSNSVEGNVVRLIHSNGWTTTYKVDPALTKDLRALGKEIRALEGRKYYMYLPPELKEKVDGMLRRLVDNDPNAGKLFEEYRTTQQEIVKTYAENPISVAKKMKEWENDFFHPAQGGDSKRHNMIISSAISFDREQEYREKCQAAITRSLIYNLCRSINQDNERGKKVLAHTSKTTKKIQPKRITARKAARMEPIRPE